MAADLRLSRRWLLALARLMWAVLPMIALGLAATASMAGPAASGAPSADERLAAAQAASRRAATLADPTRPPGLVAPVADGTPRGARSPQAPASAAPPAAAPVLQSIQLQAGQASALVDGRLVRVGDRIGHRTVVAIDAQGLLLRPEKIDRGDAARTERLDLLSGVVKRPAGTAPTTGTVQARLHDLPVALPAAAPPSATTASNTTLAGKTSP